MLCANVCNEMPVSNIFLKAALEGAILSIEVEVGGVCDSSFAVF